MCEKYMLEFVFHCNLNFSAGFGVFLYIFVKFLIVNFVVLKFYVPYTGRRWIGKYIGQK